MRIEVHGIDTRRAGVCRGMLNAFDSRRWSWRTTFVTLMLAVAACNDNTAPQEVAAGEGFVAGAAVGGDDVEIVLMPADGSSQRQLTRTAGQSYFPVWSPDAAQIAFVSTREDSRPQLYVMRADGGGVRRLSNPSDGYVDGRVSWSPDGARLVFVCRVPNDSTTQLCTINVDGTGYKRLLPAGWRGEDPAWSPDGRQIAFAGDFPSASTLRLYIVAADGGTPRMVSPAGVIGHDYQPAWSPDGQWLAFTGTRPRPPFAPGSAEVFVMRADGSGRRPLIDSMPPVETTGTPEWSPDGRRIAFAQSDFRTPRVFIANVDGTDVHPLRTIGVDGLSWAPARRE